MSIGHQRRRLAFLLAAVAVLSAGLITASRLGAADPPAASGPPAPVQKSASPFAGIPQSGATLGRAGAPVTLVEYADLQCPYCAEWSHRTLPVLVEEYVRTGKLRIVFRGLAFIGPDSERGLRAAIVAGRQNRMWDVVDGLFHRQGAENSGWLTMDMVEELAGAEVMADSGSPWVDRKLGEASREAQAAGIAGTPAFRVGRTGGPLQVVPLNSLGPEGLRPAIDAALGA